MDTFPKTEWLSTTEGSYDAHLPGGHFKFVMKRQDIALQDLCDVALRNNDRRRFLFVSKVIGRHYPVRPTILCGVARKLAEKLISLANNSPVVFFGMAETATTLGQAIFREWLDCGQRGLYIESTRRRTGGDMAFEFCETHSHAVAHAVHLPTTAEDLHSYFRSAPIAVIVDDEVTTGHTASALAEQYRKWRGGDPTLKVFLLVLLQWQDARNTHHESLSGIECLAEGSFDFHANGEFLSSPKPQHALDSNTLCRRGVRHGTIKAETIPAHWSTHAEPGERILVIGNGEYGFQPLLLAEAYESQGAIAWVQATTRSPILEGGGIMHIRRFDALSGEEYEEYLYNIPPNHNYDRVVLCLEDTLSISNNHPIWQIPKLETPENRRV